VRSDVFVDFLLQFFAELLLFIKALTKLAIFFLHLVESHLEVFFVYVKRTDFLVEVFLHLLHCLLVLRANLSDEHLIVALAAVLEKDGVNFPDRRQQRVLILCMAQGFVKHLVEAD